MVGKGGGIEFRHRPAALPENEFLIVPRGVEHRPVAEEEVCVMLFEPGNTLNTGHAASNELTRTVLEKI